MGRLECAGGTGGAGRHGDAVEVERDQERFGFDPVEADVAGVGDTPGGVTVDHRARHAGQNAAFEPVAERRHAVRLRRALVECQLRRGPEPDDGGHIFGAGAAIPFLLATGRLRREARAAPDPERPDALGAVELVGREREQIDVKRVNIDRQLPTDWTASVWKRAPRARASRARSATGWMVPISLLACITETSAVSSVIASATRSGVTTPLASTPTSVVVHPCFESAFRVCSTASCSIALATRWRRPAPARATAAPRIARLSASEPAGREDYLGRLRADETGDRRTRLVNRGLGLLAVAVHARWIAERGA